MFSSVEEGFSDADVDEAAQSEAASDSEGGNVSKPKDKLRARKLSTSETEGSMESSQEDERQGSGSEDDAPTRKPSKTHLKNSHKEPHPSAQDPSSDSSSDTVSGKSKTARRKDRSKTRGNTASGSDSEDQRDVETKVSRSFPSDDENSHLSAADDGDDSQQSSTDGHKTSLREKATPTSGVRPPKPASKPSLDSAAAWTSSGKSETGEASGSDELLKAEAPMTLKERMAIFQKPHHQHHPHPPKKVPPPVPKKKTWILPVPATSKPDEPSQLKSTSDADSVDVASPVTDAQVVITKHGGSLKDRMNALALSQQKQDDSLPIVKKGRVWKKPDDVASMQPSSEALLRPSMSTDEGTDDQTSSNGDVDAEDEDDRDRRAAIAARMAKLGGRSLHAHTQGSAKPSAHSDASKKEPIDQPVTKMDMPKIATRPRGPQRRKASEDPSLKSQNSDDAGAESQASGLSKHSGSYSASENGSDSGLSNSGRCVYRILIPSCRGQWKLILS